MSAPAPTPHPAAPARAAALARIERAARALAGGLAGLAGVALLLMMLQTVLDVLMANLAGRPIAGNLEVVSVYHMVLVVFLPLAFVEFRHEHITVELLVRHLPRRLYRAMLAAGYLVAAGFFAVLAGQTWADAVAAWRIDAVVMGARYVTVWPAKFALPVGFAAAALASLVHALRALADPGFAPEPPAHDAPPAV